MLQSATAAGWDQAGLLPGGAAVGGAGQNVAQAQKQEASPNAGGGGSMYKLPKFTIPKLRYLM